MAVKEKAVEKALLLQLETEVAWMLVRLLKVLVTKEWKDSSKRTAMLAKRPVLLHLEKVTEVAWMLARPQVVLVTREWRASVRKTVMLAKKAVSLLQLKEKVKVKE